MDDWHIILGVRETWGQTQPFVLSPSDRRHHLYAIGKSGTGKTTLLRNLILQDICAGNGVGVIDPHGDLATELLNLIPRHRIEDVVYFNPADMKYPIGFNLLGQTLPDNRHLVASGIVNVFKSVWSHSWGPRMEYILYAAVAALLDCDNVSLLGIQRMLSDAKYRGWVVRQIKDPIVRAFWVEEFEEFSPSLRHEMVAPIQNKVGQLLMSPRLRNILGQIRCRIDARFMMDNGRIFIADVSKGKLGADKANLMGALVPALSEFPLSPQHRRHWNLLVNANKAGVHLCINKATLQELVGHIQIAKKLYEEEYRGMESVFSDEVTARYVKEIILRSYFYSLGSGKTWTIEQFLDNFVTPNATSEQMENELIEWLRHNFGIAYVDDAALGMHINTKD
jgi:hypothetical protein